MREVSYLVAVLGCLFLLAASVAWWRIGHDPEGELRAAATRTTRLLESASMAVVIAVGLSGTAAILAVVGWLRRSESPDT